MISVYPVIMTDKVEETKKFWTKRMGFEIVFEADWYVSLNLDGQELAILKEGHETIPAGHSNKAQGFLVNIEVPNVDDWYEYHKLHKQNIVLDIRSEEFGQRHYILTDPNGVLVDVITNIPPGAEYEENYA